VPVDRWSRARWRRSRRRPGLPDDADRQRVDDSANEIRLGEDLPRKCEKVSVSRSLTSSPAHELRRARDALVPSTRHPCRQGGATAALRSRCRSVRLAALASASAAGGKSREIVRLGDRASHALSPFARSFAQRISFRGIVNTLAIGVSGSPDRRPATPPSRSRPTGLRALWSRGRLPRPRASRDPGLLAGLAFFWVFLFVKPLAPLRTTLFSVWLAYTVVWLRMG